MKLLLNGPPEFILFAIMMTVMVYLRIIMFAVQTSWANLELAKEEIESKKRQLSLLVFGLTVAMIEIFFIILRICLHALILYLSGKWKPSGGPYYHDLLPAFDVIILTILFGLFLYLARLFYKYDIRH